MGPNEKLFRKSYAGELLNLAEEDLKTAEYLAKGVNLRPENTLFHIQQAVEKALKSVLCGKGMPVPLTHDLYAIVDRLGSADMPPGGYDLNDLTPYASVRRYEEGEAIITRHDLDIAIQIANKVIEWAKGRINDASSDSKIKQ